MIEFRRSYKQSNGEEFVTVFSDYLEGPLVATNKHPNWKYIIKVLEQGDLYSEEAAEEIQGLVDMSIKINKEFKKLTERIAIADGIVTFDGDEVNNEITNTIVRYFSEGHDDLWPLVRFMEKLYQNPNANSREQFFNWVKNHGLSINAAGDVVAYKGVIAKGDGTYESRNSGTAIVNGKTVTGRTPISLFDTIEIPRSQVNADSNVACSAGLHVGDWDYAYSWGGGTVLEVTVNPRDVVSVPSDCNNAKVRTCRYVPVGILENKHDDLLVSTTSGDTVSRDNDYDYDYDYDGSYDNDW